jgi:uncharacterized surface protein with fasciclin (FAS1) repeats
MMYILSLAIALAPLAVHTSASFLSVLASRPELSQFNAYLSQFPRLTTTINTVDNATLLIPSNTAFTNWLQNTVPPLTPSDIENTLNYHIIHGTFPVASFTNTAQFFFFFFFFFHLTCFISLQLCSTIGPLCLRARIPDLS